MLTKQQMQQLENFKTPTLVNFSKQGRNTIQLVKADLRGYETPVWVNADIMVVYSEEFIEEWAEEFKVICE